MQHILVCDSIANALLSSLREVICFKLEAKMNMLGPHEWDILQLNVHRFHPERPEHFWHWNIAFNLQKQLNCIGILSWWKANSDVYCTYCMCVQK